ncbi:hypothetical protein HOLleu_30541 [Holothuria leucospilota]|uniref:Uncharacterized protein n=1 Tax=Holothuria leucospilota TaxID=206669 RepID=A0A9Q1BKK0_HOLLE|nr:hypothetical protein HOLleu_30541 [Holothuria leucospilota]
MEPTAFVLGAQHKQWSRENKPPFRAHRPHELRKCPPGGDNAPVGNHCNNTYPLFAELFSLRTFLGTLGVTQGACSFHRAGYRKLYPALRRLSFIFHFVDGLGQVPLNFFISVKNKPSGVARGGQGAVAPTKPPKASVGNF